MKYKSLISGLVDNLHKYKSLISGKISSVCRLLNFYTSYHTYLKNRSSVRRSIFEISMVSSVKIHYFSACLCIQILLDEGQSM